MNIKLIEEYIPSHIKELMDDRAKEKMLEFAGEIIEANKELNLTAIKTEKDFAEKHIADSLQPAFIKGFEKIKVIADTGSGAGLPGIPLGIVFPDKKITLIESNNKKSGFLNKAIKNLNLLNITVITDRAEVISRDPLLNDEYDAVIMRAFAPFAMAMEMTCCLVKEKGIIMYYCSEKQKQEMPVSGKKSEELGIKIKEFVKYSFSEDFGTRYIAIVEKLWKSKKKYPRQYAN
ncbi:MAG TPA: 16S rRNA (guanine(527)-N(7))-methyltransferase RsmG, partial [Firmicutes bacterium]|nr:16S rRNA (guanine(527)-N(7))-methyltransferase RsmG [Bacillota bacterium]